MVQLDLRISGRIGIAWLITLLIVDSNIQLAVCFSNWKVSNYYENVNQRPPTIFGSERRKSCLCATSDDQGDLEEQRHETFPNSKLSRRHILKHTLQVSTASLLVSLPPSSRAEMDSKFTFRTNNLPMKYAGTSMSSSYGNNESDCGIQTPEMKRMNVFERASPSVVYIDTFVEQRDVFSPNV